jgi:hypothetical protein
LGDKHWSGQQRFPVRAVQLFMEAQNRFNPLFSRNSGKIALRFAWENRFALFLELL